MWRYLVGGLAVLLMVAAGAVLFRGGAVDAPVLPAAPSAGVVQSDDAPAPLPDAVPEATERTREQKRFDRYDKDRNGAITREEYLTSRRKAYAKLDANHDGVLQFDEWAAKTEAKFASADHDRSGTMNAAEFATTAVKRQSARPSRCPPANASSGDGDG